MCVGVPMTVVSVSPYRAVCERDGVRVSVDTALVDGPLLPGDALLVHNGCAVRRLTPREAVEIAHALLALSRAMRGEGYAELLADLIDREPPLPPHLQAAVADTGGKA